MARCSGVLPSCPLVFVRAPCVTSTMAQSKRPRLTMMCKAVSAVLLTAFTSQPHSSSSRVICTPKVQARKENKKAESFSATARKEKVLPEAGYTRESAMEPCWRLQWWEEVREWRQAPAVQTQLQIPEWPCWDLWAFARFLSHLVQKQLFTLMTNWCW